MALKIIRGMFILACAFMGLIWTNYILDNIVAKDLTVPMTGGTQTLWYAFGGGAGALIAIALLLALKLVTQELFERLFPVFVAIVFSMIIGFGLAQYIRLFWPIENEDDVLRHVYTTTTLVLLFGFVGIFLGLTKASNWESLISVVKKRQVQFGNPKIVDTSVIIDGRILEIVEAGFIEGSLVIPRFVLNELQHIADSADLLRRTKGRRGLDILKSMQEGSSGIVVEIIDDDPTDAREVDAKIVALAREYKAKVLTTDYNLNKVAQIEGIDVLNINDLANALKPAALPDEHIEVKIVKEGKEADQGVGYLDDGTMIVVDGGRKYVGQKASVVVTSVLQTAAGRMIFTKINQVLTNEPPQAEAS